MAEKLRTIQPTSSIANALNLDAVRAAMGPVPLPSRSSAAAVASMPESADAAPGAPQRASVVPIMTPAQAPMSQRPQAPEPRPYTSREPTGESASVMRQFQITPSADATLQKVMAAYSQATGLELTRSEFLRAVLRALTPTVELHAREAGGIGVLKRPKNEAWLFHRRDELERAIARAFTAAMRAAPTLE